MVQIYKSREAEEVMRAGYSARYTADLEFKEKIDTCGVISVTIPSGISTTPHTHTHLQELFIALTALEIHIDSKSIELEPGDVVLVEPGESHSFSANSSLDCSILALKFPNLKDDKR